MFFDYDKIREVYLKDSKFFTFVLEEGVPGIVDYSLLDREILVSEVSIEYGEEKEKKPISSIDELRELFKELVIEVKEILNDYVSCVWGETSPFDTEQNYSQLKNFFNIKTEDEKSLIDQLIIDVLYDKYANDSMMTLNEYCEKHFYFKLEKEWININDHRNPVDHNGNALQTKGAAVKMMGRRIKTFVEKMSKPSQNEELKKRFIFPDLYTDYIKDKNVKKSRWVWDLIYYTETLTAFKQYRRDYWSDIEEDYIKAANELNDYDKFVEGVFKPKDGDNKDYYYKSMNFYYLQSISRLEFAYKLAERLEQDSITNIEKERFLTTMFYTDVSCPCVKEINGRDYLFFIIKRNHYSPMLLLEDAWLHRTDYKINESENNPFFYNPINFIRAQAHHLFNYHYKFSSNCYDDIHVFLKENYNLLEKYHTKNKAWKDIKSKELLSLTQKTYIDHMRMICNAIFSKVNKMNIRNWIDSNGKNDKDYKELFGISKEEFERCLHLLESKHNELHKKGGRKSELDVRDKFLVTIEYYRYNRTMENIAFDYGVGKRQISEAVKWVEETLNSDIEL